MKLRYLLFSIFSVFAPVEDAVNNVLDYMRACNEGRMKDVIEPSLQSLLPKNCTGFSKQGREFELEKGKLYAYAIAELVELGNDEVVTKTLKQVYGISKDQRAVSEFALALKMLYPPFQNYLLDMPAVGVFNLHRMHEDLEVIVDIYFA